MNYCYCMKKKTHIFFNRTCLYVYKGTWVFVYTSKRLVLFRRFVPFSDSVRPITIHFELFETQSLNVDFVFSSFAWIYCNTIALRNTRTMCSRISLIHSQLKITKLYIKFTFQIFTRIQNANFVPFYL